MAPLYLNTNYISIRFDWNVIMTMEDIEHDGVRNAIISIVICIAFTIQMELNFIKTIFFNFWSVTQ